MSRKLGGRAKWDCLELTCLGFFYLASAGNFVDNRHQGTSRITACYSLNVYEVSHECEPYSFSGSLNAAARCQNMGELYELQAMVIGVRAVGGGGGGGQEELQPLLRFFWATREIWANVF